MRKGEAAIKRRRRNRHDGSGIACKAHDGTDRISELPHDILISIISRLTLREAIATSVVSRRWRYLHTYNTHLDFPTFKPQVESSSQLKFQKKRFQNHVNIINRVLDSHRGGRAVKEMRLCMYSMEGAPIEKLVDFALTKEVEVIDINMPFIPGCWPRSASSRYLFGLSNLVLTKSLPAIKCLKQLSLEGVEVNAQDFDILVSNFLSLETLFIRSLRRLEKVVIAGHPNLKHLEITCGSLEIRDVINLVSLRINYIPSECALEMENIPKLTEFYSCESGGEAFLHHTKLYSKIPSNIRDQLQLIYLSTDPFTCNWKFDFSELPFRFVNLKYLELEMRRMYATSLYPFRNLIHACSSLEKLVIKLLWWPTHARLIEFEESKAPKCYRHIKLSPKLKVFEMEGYAGSPQEFALASHIIYYAKNLERVSVVACDASKEIRRRALGRAQDDFRLISPPSLDLVFI